MVKTLSISKEEMDKRFKITNIELVKEFEKKRKKCCVIDLTLCKLGMVNDF